jgi:archaellum component FlaG (FlaF/FlaG flagellin family)
MRRGTEHLPLEISAIRRRTNKDFVFKVTLPEALGYDLINYYCKDIEPDQAMSNPQQTSSMGSPQMTAALSSGYPPGSQDPPDQFRQQRPQGFPSQSQRNPQSVPQMMTTQLSTSDQYKKLASKGLTTLQVYSKSDISSNLTIDISTMPNDNRNNDERRKLVLESVNSLIKESGIQYPELTESAVSIKYKGSYQQYEWVTTNEVEGVSIEIPGDLARQLKEYCTNLSDRSKQDKEYRSQIEKQRFPQQTAQPSTQYPPPPPTTRK